MWLIAGLVLVIAEMLTGTFYLLVLGIAAFFGALVAYLHFDVGIQAAVAAVVAVAGSLWVRGYRRRTARKAMPPLDLGQAVSFDAWTDEGARRARVRYRDTLWDARVEGEPGTAAPGDTFYIAAVEGSILTVSPRRP
jgi:membrane protein implicated in regulation of membrane protease activity